MTKEQKETLQLRVQPPIPPLQDGEILLRPWALDDGAAVCEALRDPMFSKWIPVIPHPYKESDWKQWFSRCEEGWAQGNNVTFAITDAKSGSVLGSLGIHPQTEDPEIAEAGYWVAKEAQGHGVATRSLKLASHWILADHPIVRVYLRVNPDNLASMKVAERAGFKPEGIQRQADKAHGQRHDVAFFSLLRSDLLV